MVSGVQYGNSTLDRASQQNQYRCTPPSDRPPAELYTDSYRQEWGDFLRHVRGEKPYGAQEDQVRLIEVLEACYQSAREGHEVIL